MLCWQLCPALISRCWCYLPVLLPDICPQISPLFTQHSSLSISSSIIGDKIAGRPKLNWTLSGFKLILLARPLPLIVWTEGRRFQNPGNAKKWRVGLTHANHSTFPENMLIYTKFWMHSFTQQRVVSGETDRTEMDLFTSALIILFTALLFVSTRSMQHHPHHKFHCHHHLVIGANLENI